MDIATLTIGDELLNGDLCDTNTAVIASRLVENNLTLREAVTVGDCEADIIATLQRLADRHTAIIVTGGLGPTEDDLTSRAAARAFARPLRLSDEALQQIRERFRSRNRPMHPGNEKQALLPGKATIITNRQGTAPGFRLSQGHAEIFFLPGVPEEMLAMFVDTVLPALLQLCPAPTERCRTILNVFGLAEPAVEELLNRAVLPEGIELAFAVDLPIVRVKLLATGDDARHRVDRAELLARKALGDHIVSIGEESLAGVTARLLPLSGQTLALAESCTGGLICTLLTDQPGASSFLERGIVSYANTAKADWLDVPLATLDGPGAVSADCARAMARGIRRTAATNIGLAVTGIAGPDGGTAEKPVGTVYIAMATDDGERIERFLFHGNRQQVRLRTAYTALDWLRRQAMEIISQAAEGSTVP